MRTIIIFDSMSSLSFLGSLAPDDKVLLFPLTINYSEISSVRRAVSSKAHSIEIIETSKLVNTAADEIRGKYIEFIAGLPDRLKINGKGLRELFALDNKTSLWWFSLISEKNTYKSDSFNTLVQLDAVIRFLKQNSVEKILLATSNAKLERSLLDYALKIQVSFQSIKVCSKKCKTNDLLMACVRNIIPLFAGLAVKLAKVKWKLNGLKSNKPIENSLICMAYYPAYDYNLAKKDIFKHKQYADIQKSLEATKRNIVWVVMYVQNQNKSFNETMEDTIRFNENGYNIHFVEEFSSVTILIKALIELIRSSLLFHKVESELAEKHSFGDYNFYEIFREDWYSSFSGPVGFLGIYYFLTFKSLLTKVKANKCLYYCEMHAWEKALISARNSVDSKHMLYGYQSGTISKMLLNFFNSVSEISSIGKYSIPKPSKVLCDGELPLRYMKESGWDDKELSIVEAVRYSYLKNYMNKTWHKNVRSVLIALSISPEENSSILNMAYESFKELKDIEVWVRPHPFLDFNMTLSLSGISLEKFPFRLRNDPLEKLLPDVKVLVGGETGVSVEALAFGCKIVVINSPAWINMSPFRSIQTSSVMNVYSSDELKNVVSETCDEVYDVEDLANENRRLINDFFCIDHNIEATPKFMSHLE